MKDSLTRLVAYVLFLAFSALPALAASPSGSFIVLHGVNPSVTTGGVPTIPSLALTAQAAATVTSSDFTLGNGVALVCTFEQTSHTGSPSSTFSIQGKSRPVPTTRPLPRPRSPPTPRPR